MSNVNGTKTEQNLKDAFAGESQARNKYTYFAAVAKKEGFEKIAAIFLETAENEKEHAKLHFKHLAGIGSTIDNLKAAAAGETDEFMDMYPRMAKEAREEGFADIAFLFESVGKIEKHHKERYQQLLTELETGTHFTKNEKVTWKCIKCGHIHEGTEALKLCPVCKHPQAYFEQI
ncbi:MAG: rubrerythrin family protein [Betaproteobacteria bacterium HGW-Betaproteobacteria-9]|nr:MAG: rubrerythrin family protein [Betaproteobacteria bacterium HGW-Betaproteobacteria-9]